VRSGPGAARRDETLRWSVSSDERREPRELPDEERSFFAEPAKDDEEVRWTSSSDERREPCERPGEIVSREVV